MKRRGQQVKRCERPLLTAIQARVRFMSRFKYSFKPFRSDHRLVRLSSLFAPRALSEQRSYRIGKLAGNLDCQQTQEMTSQGEQYRYSQ